MAGSVTSLETLAQQLAAGFDALHEEYLRLYGQHTALEKKLTTAREQYNELARLYGQTSTPPLSLASSDLPLLKRNPELSPTAAELLERNIDPRSKDAAVTVRTAATAASNLRLGLLSRQGTSSHGVKIWSGPAADAPEGTSSMMPSISESPLEQDFTVEGKPSRLGCPFASMANKKLTSHAASVLSRYNHSNPSVAPGSVLSSSSRINGRETYSRRQERRRESIQDPIHADTCALSQPGEAAQAAEMTTRETAVEQDPVEAGVCPIRFLDQHSPEEVATYFEKHKHELPRSHEVCVMRYQSNEEQIKQLDAKYGNLVSMIAGLGEKHKDMLPKDVDHDLVADAESDEKVRKWASSVSAQAAAPRDVEEEENERPEEDRQSHFERPLRDIRLGESPSRPWGIPVPAKYMEEAQSHTSSRPAEVVTSTPVPASPEAHTRDAQQLRRPPAVAKCPFGHTAGQGRPAGHPRDTMIDDTHDNNDIHDVTSVAQPASPMQGPVTPEARRQPAAPDPHDKDDKRNGRNEEDKEEEEEEEEEQPAQEHQHRHQAHIIFSGPVFIGYGADDAARFLRQYGSRPGL